MEFPPKPVPQTPVGLTKLTLGVEESRAQRHQRQQSRFRDRGGIFKPSNRNTLGDILMGRRAPSPKKSTRRSASRSPSKRDKTPLIPGPSIDADKSSYNDSTVSPTKASRKTPKASVEGSRTVHESESQETSAAQPAAKVRSRPPKPTGNATKKGKSGPKPKSKTSKSESAPRRKRTESQKSKASSATEKSDLDAATTSAQAPAKSLSRLSTIVEEAERSEISDDDGSMVANTNEVKRKGKRKHDAATAETSKTVQNHMADIGVEDAGNVREKKKGTNSRTEARPKKKPSSNKSVATVHTEPQELVSSNHPNAPKCAKYQANECDSRPKIAAMNGNEAATHSAKLVDDNQIPEKEGEPSKLATRRKRQKTGPCADDVEVENQGSAEKRVRPCTTRMEDGEMSKVSKQGEHVANASALKCRDVDSTAQFPKKSRRDGQAKQGSSITNVQLEMSGTKSKKRIRDPKDSSLRLSPSKRFKPDDADTSLGVDKNLCDWFARSAKDKPTNEVAHFEVPDKRVPPSRKLKENTTTSKKPSKPSTQGNKSKTTNKRAKGLPRRVLQRLKNSEPHPVDDEPDPIDFLS